MDTFSGTAGDLHRDSQAFLEGDLKKGPRGDCQTDCLGDAQRDLRKDLRRDFAGDLPEDLPRDFHGDFDGVLRVELRRGRRGFQRGSRRPPGSIRRSCSRRGEPSRGLFCASRAEASGRKQEPAEHEFSMDAKTEPDLATKARAAGKLRVSVSLSSALPGASRGRLDVRPLRLAGTTTATIAVNS